MTSATSISLPPESVRNVSESVISAMSTRDNLNQLLELLDTVLKHENHKALCEDMAERLSKVAGKEPAWRWRYVQSVASGTVEASKKFTRAVDVLAVTFDGVPVVFANSSPVTVYAQTGTIADGALVMSGSRRCATPSCTVFFVPNVPWRKYCPVCGQKNSHNT